MTPRKQPNPLAGQWSKCPTHGWAKHDSDGKRRCCTTNPAQPETDGDAK